MGADVSADRPGYAARQAEFERRYREMYGENLSREELIERYRLEKLKADQKRREQQAEAAERKYRSDDDRYSHRERRYSDGRHGGRSSRKHQEDNAKTSRGTHERERRRHDDDHYHHGHRSHRSRKSRDENSRRERRSRHRERSSRDRDRSERSSSNSSKENRKHRRSSPKMRSSDEGDRSSRRENRRDRSSRNKERSDKERSKHRKGDKPSSRSRSKHRKQQSDSDVDKENIKRESKSKKSSKSTENKDIESQKVKSKKKKTAEKAEHYKSAPDLTEDREYGRGAWQRSHDYFGVYEQRPQSWVEQLANERSAAMPAPVMERQIIYSIPQNASHLVDGIGFPLSQPALTFPSIPQETSYAQRQQRPVSMDMSLQETPVQAQMASPITAVKIPAGAVPALGPNARPTNKKTSSKQRHQNQTGTLPGSSTLPRNHRSHPNYQMPPDYGKYSSLTQSEGPTPKPRQKSPTKDKNFVMEQSPRSPMHSPNRKSQKGRITAISAREDFESMLASDYNMSNMMSDEYMSEDFPSFPGNYRPNQEIFVDDVVFRNQLPIKNQAATTNKNANVGNSDSDATTDEENVLNLGEDFSANSFSYSSGFDLEIPEGFCFDSDTSAVKGHKSGSQKRHSSKVREVAVQQTHAKPLHTAQHNGQVKRRSAKQETFVLTAVEPVSRHKHTKSRSPERKNNMENSKTSTRKGDTRKSKTRDQSQSPNKHEYAERRQSPRQQSPRQQSPRQKAASRQKNQRPTEGTDRYERRRDHSSSPSREIIVPATKAPLLRSPNSKGHKGKRKTKRIQHPPSDDNYERIIIPSNRKWTSGKVNPRTTHDVGVGTKSIKPQLKSIAVQTPKKKQPPAQPIYFLKPISSQEVFIDDSSVASRSETDISQAQTYSAVSTSTYRSRSATSWSKSSTGSFTADCTEESEVESVVQNFRRNSSLYASMKKEEPALSASSVTSFDPDPVPVAKPAMKLGVSDTIQASSYTGRGGKVFCITRSRHGSPPPSARDMTDDNRSVDDFQYRSQPWHRDHEMRSHDEKSNHYDRTLESPEIVSPKSAPHILGYQQFDAHEVGKWVLDCYSQDQKLRTVDSQDDPSPKLATKNSSDHKPIVSHVNLKKQTAVEYEASFDLPTTELVPPPEHGSPKVIPLTREALRNHEDSSRHYSNQSEESGTELSADHVSRSERTSDIGVFQQELSKTRNKIGKRVERQKTPEPLWKSKQSRLKQWNDSPTSNVVLAEVGPVNDTTDEDSSQAASQRSSSPEPVRKPPPETSYTTQRPIPVTTAIPVTKTTRQVIPASHRPPYVDTRYVEPTRQPAEKTKQPLKRQPYMEKIYKTSMAMNPPNYAEPVVAANVETTQDPPRTSYKPRTVQAQDTKPVSPVFPQNAMQMSGKPEPKPFSNASNSRTVASEASQGPPQTNYKAQPKPVSAVVHNTTQGSLMSPQEPPFANYQSQSGPSAKETKDAKPTVAVSRQLNPNVKGSQAPVKPIVPLKPASNADENVGVPRSSDKKTEESSDSEAETGSTLSSDTSEEIISPKANLRKALQQRGPYTELQGSNEIPKVQPRSRLSSEQKPATLQNGYSSWNKRPNQQRPFSADSRPQVKPDAYEDWRLVGSPSKIPVEESKSNPNAKQQDPIVPRARMQEVYASENVKNTYLHAQPRQSTPPQKPVVQSSVAHPVSSGNDSESSSTPVVNPFKKMDEEEINSIVEKIPGRSTMTQSGSDESDIMEKLNRTRTGTKQETLEERTARILGIHRRTSDDDSASSSEDESQKKIPSPQGAEAPAASSSEPKEDLSTYLNNLLTGVAPVSPGTRQKYFASDLAKKQHVTSPLATNSVSSSASQEAMELPHAASVQTQQILHEKSDSEGSQSSSDVAITVESFTIGVDYSVLDPSVDPKVKTGNNNQGQMELPAEYEIPENIGNARASPSSPKGRMMLSYGNNIYAETPGFHKQQPSYDSTESDDIEGGDPIAKVQEDHTSSDTRSLDSPVPISAGSQPLTDKELEIIREMEEDNSRTASQSSLDEMSANGDSNPVKNGPQTESNQLNPVPAGSTSPSGRSWSRTREEARDKIAKSVGFTLDNSRSSAPNFGSSASIPKINSEEYDIKILSVNGKREPQLKNQTAKIEEGSLPHDDRGTLENVMESIGLDPNETWTMSV